MFTVSPRPTLIPSAAPACVSGFFAAFITAVRGAVAASTRASVSQRFKNSCIASAGSGACVICCGNAISKNVSEHPFTRVLGFWLSFISNSSVLAQVIQ